MCKKLPAQARKYLYRNKNILTKRNEELNKKEKELLKTLLSYSKELKIAYEYKEEFVQWYDLSPSYELAKVGFERLINKYKEKDILLINKSIKTLENWKDEIINYHKCRYTNAYVEGKHNKVKAMTRRYYCLPNREMYESFIRVQSRPLS